MTKNLIEEVQELVQQIKNEYREGIDFKIVGGKNGHPLWVKIKSLRLKKELREKFGIPILVKDFFLDYYQSNSEHDWVAYKVGGDDDGKDVDLLITTEKREAEKNETENCKQCKQSVTKKEGWIEQWNGRKIGENEPNPNIIAYFHPECAKNYFTNEEQPNENNTRKKEKLLRNLDKICLDPLGDLANAELLMDKEIENKYYWNPNYSLSEHKKIAAKVYKVEIEGEEIDLEKSFYTGSEIYRELKRAIIQEIKQNPQEWKIGFSSERPELQHVKWTVQHQSGRRHWKTGIERFWPDISEKEKYWTEIEALINGSALPVEKPEPPQKLNDAEKVQIQKFMEQNDIVSLKLVGGKLLIEYNSKKSERKEINNPELQAIKNYLEKQTDKSLNYEQLKTSSPNQLNKSNYALWISIGVGGVAFGILIAYFLFRRKRKSKQK